MPKQTFIERYIVERTNNAQIRLKKPSEKAEICWEDLRNGIQVKGQYRQK